MRAEVLQPVLALLAEHEGRSRCIYPDSKGNPTVGVGHLLPNVQSALALPFVMRGQTVRATPAQIASAYGYVRQMRQPFHLIELQDADIDALETADLERFEPIMLKTFPAPLPVAGEVALWDMVFNLGSFRDWPMLVTAVHAGDWDRAAAECVRRDVSDKRNEDTQKLLLQARAA